jgi:hypothetical protein
MPTLRGMDQKRLYSFDHGELAAMSAAAAHSRSRDPPAASVSKKR